MAEDNLKDRTVFGMSSAYIDEGKLVVPSGQTTFEEVASAISDTLNTNH